MSQPPGDASRWFLAQRDGTIISFDNNQTGTNQQLILDIQSYLQYTDLQSAADSQQAGITGFAIHPDFPASPYMYVAINAKPGLDENVFSTLYRFTSTDGGLTFDSSSAQTLLSIEMPNPWHHIGTVIFGPGGYLYTGIGEGEGIDENLAQDLTDLRGSVLRIDIDSGTPYSIPADNPLVGSGYKEEIYAWGFRNPWRFSFDSETDELWLGDVGPDRSEEVNYVIKGGNYGWNTVLGTQCYEWNADLTDAELVGAIGKFKTLQNGVVWIYPSQEQCFSCHTDIAGTDIGLEILQLNGDMLYPSTDILANQLNTLVHIGLLTKGLPEFPEQLPALSPIDDTVANNEQKVKSYLHTNCSSCHRPGSQVQANWDARFATPLEDTNLCNVTPDHGDLGAIDGRLIKPGNSANSILSLRTLDLGDKRMPPIGASIIDPVGTSVIINWINALSSCDGSNNNQTVYENTEDGLTSRWSIRDNDPAGTVSNIDDGTINSRVIELTGNPNENGYGLSLDDNSSQYIIQWRGAFDNFYSVVVHLDTSEGNRYMIYQPRDYDALGAGKNVAFGTGSQTRDGQWYTFIRDLEANLATAQPEVTINNIKRLSVTVRSSRIHDVRLLDSFPEDN